MRKKNFHVYCTLIQIFEGMPNGGPQNREEKLWKITRELVIETHYCCCCCLLKFLLPNELKNSPFLWVLPMKGKELQHSKNLVVDSSARDHNFSSIFNRLSINFFFSFSRNCIIILLLQVSSQTSQRKQESSNLWLNNKHLKSSYSNWVILFMPPILFLGEFWRLTPAT